MYGQNGVASSAVDNAFLRKGAGRSNENQNPRIDFVEYFKAVLLGRIVEPKDVSGPILFLVSNASRYITGQILHVNGGAFMQ